MAPCPHTVLLSLARAAKCNRHGGGIDESLARERKIKRRKRNFSLDLENFIASISLSTLDLREWQETILFPMLIFESNKKNLYPLSIFESGRKKSVSTLIFGRPCYHVTM